MHYLILSKVFLALKKQTPSFVTQTCKPDSDLQVGLLECITSFQHNPVASIPRKQLVNGLIALLQGQSLNDGPDVVESSNVEHVTHLCTPAHTATNHPAQVVYQQSEHV